ncbi:glycoside hydrolase family 25 protein [Croceicoccus bisphenolivorans]|uniref:glycoside hydrolase family 25 protein n=1 Tax=Croceicoccus bisphenolivorans TaxID=1783232 RepID=UPI000AE657DB|nr:glycoside hydrolase family 25 protein [Croceicoccus bisphenolivorans]
MVRALFRRRPGLWIVALVLLAAIAGGIWWKLAHWRPDRTDFPVQGVWLTGNEGAVSIPELPGDGASFAYVTASQGARGRNDGFTQTMEAARKAGMQVGAVHRYDPCVRADLQSANFVTVVPRDADLLAPAVLLDGSGEDCRPRVRSAELESELVVFLNQIEMHASKRAVLAPSASFEAEYHFGARAERKLWLARDWLQPEYAGRPWEMWTANSALHASTVDGSVHWVVARP